MARLPRLTLAGYTHHIIQRGNNRQAVFLSDDDRLRWLALLREYSVQHRVAIHAYVLMDNHIHLLVTSEDAEGVPKMMQAIGRRYARYFNDTHDRSGTLWEGRYRSTLIESQSYLLRCMVYIDFNPVRTGLVAQPLDYPWSSHGHYVGARVDKSITSHSLIWALGNTPFAREAAYAEWVNQGLSTRETQALSDAALHGWALGSEAFLTQLQRATSRRPIPHKPGRPPKRDSAA